MTRYKPVRKRTGPGSADPFNYIAAAAILEEASRWEARPWNRLGQGPTRINTETAHSPQRTSR